MVINKSVEIYRIESKVRLRALLCATGTEKDPNYLLMWEMGARLESQPILPLGTAHLLRPQHTARTAYAREA